jgi:hypothetical protein
MNYNSKYGVFLLVFFFNLDLILYIYGDLELIICFNIYFIWLLQYKKNISTSRYNLFIKNLVK